MLGMMYWVQRRKAAQSNLTTVYTVVYFSRAQTNLALAECALLILSYYHAINLMLCIQTLLLSDFSFHTEYLYFWLSFISVTFTYF